MSEQAERRRLARQLSAATAANNLARAAEIRAQLAQLERAGAVTTPEANRH